MYTLTIKFKDGKTTTLESTSSEHLESIGKAIYNSNIADYVLVTYEDGEIMASFGRIQ